MTAVLPSAENLTLEDIGQFTDNGEAYTIGGFFHLNGTGDTRVMWDSRNPDEVRAARAQFNELIKTHVAYEVEGKKGKQTNRQIREFNPSLERIVFVAPQQAG